MSPLFSIIIPTYNSELSLGKTLKSVLSQEFRDFEILILDGLSSDKTISIAKSFNDSRLKIYSEKDTGVYDAMNNGIKKSQGTWLYFLGSDDYMINEKVLSQVHSQIDGATDVLYGSVMGPTLGSKYDGEFDFEKLFNKNICHQSIFYNKRVFSEFGFYDTKYITWADYVFNIRAFYSNKIKWKYIDEVIAFYDGDGISSRFVDHSFKDDYKEIFIKNASSKLSYASLRNLKKGFIYDAYVAKEYGKLLKAVFYWFRY